MTLQEHTTEETGVVQTRPLTCQELVLLHRRLLRLETAAAQKQDKQKDTVRLNGLQLRHFEDSEGGGTVTWFRSKEKSLALHTGDYVNVEDDTLSERKLDVGKIKVGVVGDVAGNEAEVFLKGNPELVQRWLTVPKDHRFRMTVQNMDSELACKWLDQALIELLTLPAEGAARTLRAVLFAERPLEEPRTSISSSPQLLNTHLNEGQRSAVRFAMQQRHFAIIHGPPGTGKTTILVELIRQHVQLGQRLLVCAQSHSAVNNLLEKLLRADRKLPVVRLGNEARIPEQYRKYSLHVLVNRRIRTDPTEARIRRQINQLSNEKTKYAKLRGQFKRVSKSVLLQNGIVLGTLMSASMEGQLLVLDGNECEKHEQFDLVVIDECSQALEAACWLAISRGRRLLVAGDHLQLPPTIISQVAAEGGLAVSLMERVVSLHGDKVTRMLCTQHRMHQLICRWPSEQFYQSRLVPAEAVRTHTLSQLGVRDTPATRPTLLLVDTARCRLSEKAEYGGSRTNTGEARVLLQHARRLVNAGLKPGDIGIIAPYKAQAALIGHYLAADRRLEEIEVDTVDSFQGREKAAILLSMVRSNNAHKVGFVSNERRLNVAVTRARQQLFVVCDTDTIGAHPLLGSLVQYMKKHGETKSPHDYLPDGHVRATHSEQKPAQSSGQKPAALCTLRKKPTPARLVTQQRLALFDIISASRHLSAI